MAQNITVIGDPLRCGELDCQDIATVMMRQRDREGVSVIQYCDACWLAYRRGYAPMVARDEVQAVAEANAILSGGDDGKHETGARQ